jgi:tetratricopeptide (TPR) repeat protein
MPIQCPNPECGHRNIKVTPIDAALDSTSSRLWPIFLWSSFWKMMKGVAILWLWLILVLWIGAAQTAAGIVLALGALISVSLFWIYRTYYASAEKIQVVYYRCPVCRYRWFEITSPVDLKMRWIELEIAAARRQGNRRRAAGALVTSGCWLLRNKNIPQAIAQVEEGLAIFRALGDKAGIAAGLVNRGIGALYQSEYLQAEALFREGLGSCKARKDWRSIANALNNLGLALIFQDKSEEAVPLLRDSLISTQKMQDKSGIAASLDSFATVAQRQGQPQRAARLFGAAQKLDETLQTCLSPDGLPGHAQSVLAVRSQLGAATFDVAFAEGRALSMDRAIEYALSSISQ